MTTQLQFGFTPAEHEVWALRFLGHTPDTISSILNIEQVTVEKYLKQCLAKCQHHIAGEGEITKERRADTNSANVRCAQHTYPPVVFAPVPEFAAFYL